MFHVYIHNESVNLVHIAKIGRHVYSDTRAQRNIYLLLILWQSFKL